MQMSVLLHADMYAGKCHIRHMGFVCTTGCKQKQATASMQLFFQHDNVSCLSCCSKLILYTIITLCSIQRHRLMDTTATPVCKKEVHAANVRVHTTIFECLVFTTCSQLLHQQS